MLFHFLKKRYAIIECQGWEVAILPASASAALLLQQMSVYPP